MFHIWHTSCSLSFIHWGAVAELLHLQKSRFTVIAVAKNLLYDFWGPSKFGGPRLQSFSLMANPALVASKQIESLNQFMGVKYNRGSRGFRLLRNDVAVRMSQTIPKLSFN